MSNKRSWAEIDQADLGVRNQVFNLPSQTGEELNSQTTSVSQPLFKAAKSGSIKFIGLLFSSAMRLIMGVVMARFMGADQYGLYSLANTAFYLIVSLAMLGMYSALVRYIPLYISRRDQAGLWGVLQIGLGIPFLLSLLIGLGLMLFAEPFAILVFKEPRLISVFNVAALALPFGAIITSAGASLQGFKQIQYDVIAEDIFLPFVKLVLVALLVFTGLNAVKAMTAHAIGSAFTCLLLLFFLNKFFPLKRPLSSAHREFKEVARFAGPIYGSTLINLVGANLHTLLLGTLYTAMTVGIFTAASQVSLVGVLFFQAIGTAVMPLISELHGKNESTQLKSLYQITTKWIFTFTLPFFLIVLLFSKNIMLLFGKDFIAGSVGLIILSVGNLINAGTGVNGEMILMTGNAWLNTFNTFIGLTLQITLGLLLIPRWGTIGAAIAVSTATSTLNIIRTIEVFVTLRLWPYNHDILKAILVGIITTLATWGMMSWVFVGDSQQSFGLNAGFFVLLYIVLISTMGFAEEDKMLLTRLRDRLRFTLSI